MNSLKLTVAIFCSYNQKNIPGHEIELLRLCISSIKKAYEERVNITLITDDQLDLSLARNWGLSVQIAAVDSSQLLLYRTRAYLKLLREHDWKTPVALLDYDILMLRHLDALFNHSEDIFVTGRNYSKTMPINGGVVIFNNRNPNACLNFYELVARNYERLPIEQLQWWGDQLSLATTIFSNPKSLGPDVIISSSGSSVRLIPRNVYNYTPYDVDSGIAIPKSLDNDTHRYLLNSVVLAHFKGPRKHLMTSFGRSLF